MAVRIAPESGRERGYYRSGDSSMEEPIKTIPLECVLRFIVRRVENRGVMEDGWHDHYRQGYLDGIREVLDLIDPEEDEPEDSEGSN